MLKQNTELSKEITIKTSQQVHHSPCAVRQFVQANKSINNKKHDSELIFAGFIFRPSKRKNLFTFLALDPQLISKHENADSLFGIIARWLTNN